MPFQGVVIDFVQGTVLYDAGDTAKRAYFLLKGVASLLAITEGGETIEVSMIGNEGMIGVPAVLLGCNTTPYQAMAQSTIDALEITAEALKREFDRSETLRHLLLHYTHALLCQTAQSIVCSHFHTVEQRLCRWLLTNHDRAHSNTFHLTHEFISHMLGIPRTHVTMTARILQRKNLIRCKRGEIIIINKRGLEANACEWYRIMKQAGDGFLDA